MQSVEVKHSHQPDASSSEITWNDNEANTLPLDGETNQKTCNDDRVVFAYLALDFSGCPGCSIHWLTLPTYMIHLLHTQTLDFADRFSSRLITADWHIN